MQHCTNVKSLTGGKGLSLSNINIEEIGDNHLHSSTDTPIRPDAFTLTNGEKIDKIEGLFKQVMETLGLDLTDDSLRGTPRRVAKMYVEELFNGLNPADLPNMTLFENKYRYNQMLVEKDITVYSHCEHHFVPIFGKAHIAYISSGKVIGLSKLNRLVDYYARRPQVQERLTMQIGRALQQALETEDVAVVIDAKHMCVASRGIRDTHSATVTTFYEGQFVNSALKEEFFRYAGLTTAY